MVPGGKPRTLTVPGAAVKMLRRTPEQDRVRRSRYGSSGMWMRPAAGSLGGSASRGLGAVCAER
jgi:hypothetical protein